MSATQRSYREGPEGLVSEQGAPRLQRLLDQTGDHAQPFGKAGAVQVFNRTEDSWRYYRLSDYVVSSAVSGPSIVLVPREPTPEQSLPARHRGRDGDTLLGVDPNGGPNACPPRPFFVRLPSGMRHWFESEHAARDSQYWPEVAS